MTSIKAFYIIFQNKLSRNEPNVRDICKANGLTHPETIEQLVQEGYCFEMYPNKPTVRQWQRESESRMPQNVKV
jgi:hypothetical protein